VLATTEIRCGLGGGRLVSGMVWAVLGVLAWGLGGCSGYQYYNRAGYVHKGDAGVRFSEDDTGAIFFKTTYFYPVRDVFDWRWQWSRLCGKPLPTSNLSANGTVENSSFYTNRPIAGVSGEVLARVAGTGERPVGPWQVDKVKVGGGTPGFFGRDASGRRYLVKLDDADRPELGSGAAAVVSRLYHALGYLVPATYVVTVSGTGDERFDGRRATAVELVGGEVLGIYKYDWVKDRREFRALKLAAMWLNDVDRSDNNNLATAEADGLVRFYLLDFNGALGSWQGRAKEPWQGQRYRWDVEHQLVWLATLGLAGGGRGEEEGATCSQQLGYLRGRFEAEQWRSEKPNPAFERMSGADAAWMGAKIGQFSREQLAAIVAEARYSDAAEAERLVTLLLERRAVVLAYARQLGV